MKKSIFILFLLVHNAVSFGMEDGIQSTQPTEANNQSCQDRLLSKADLAKLKKWAKELSENCQYNEENKDKSSDQPQKINISCQANSTGKICNHPVENADLFSLYANIDNHSRRNHDKETPISCKLESTVTPCYKVTFGCLKNSACKITRYLHVSNKKEIIKFLANYHNAGIKDDACSSINLQSSKKSDDSTEGIRIYDYAFQKNHRIPMDDILKESKEKNKKRGNSTSQDRSSKKKKGEKINGIESTVLALAIQESLGATNK